MLLEISRLIVIQLLHKNVQDIRDIQEPKNCCLIKTRDSLTILIRGKRIFSHFSVCKKEEKKKTRLHRSVKRGD